MGLLKLCEGNKFDNYWVLYLIKFKIWQDTGLRMIVCNGLA